MMDVTAAQKFAIWVLPVLFAITVHEVAHGWVARKLGDNTAWMLGRLTLNPIKHIDPVGTILVPGLLFVTSGMIFGWAKPVPVNWRNLGDIRRDMFLVAMAGPMANLFMAIIWGIVAKLAQYLGSSYFSIPLYLMGMAGIQINLLLMVINLLPIPPLDGGRVLNAVLPPSWSYVYQQLEPYGLLIMAILLYTGVIVGLILPIMEYFYSLIMLTLGLT
ncbi:MAG: site-2 protease family protein [Gammaproteobacteria bacterium]|nr:site-2 protease family protein [Gammaproteobacteria bacterium]